MIVTGASARPTTLNSRPVAGKRPSKLAPLAAVE
jgi:hypothetical protein